MPTSGSGSSAGTATIGDTVWIDIDADLFRDPGEVGLSGVTVRLYEDTNNDGVGDVRIATRVTDAGGMYLFTNITADGVRDYVVTSTPHSPR